MATRVFADEELARLREFPEISREELYQPTSEMSAVFSAHCTAAASLRAADLGVQCQHRRRGAGAWRVGPFRVVAGARRLVHTPVGGT